MLNKKKHKNLILTLIIILFIISLYFLSYQYLQNKKEKIYNNINLLLYEEEIPSHIESNEELKEDNIENNNDSNSSDDYDNNDSNIDTNNSNKEPLNTSKNNNTNTKPIKNKSYYIGKIKIPEINLEKGFVDPNSKYNNVHYNITIINKSNMPNIDKGNFILAAHSGNCTVCYFDKLYKLNINDIIEVYYQNIKYTYTITNIYKEPKTGYITIHRNYQKKTITLVTCTNNDDFTQTIYIGEIKSEEAY